MTKTETLRVTETENEERERETVMGRDTEATHEAGNVCPEEVPALGI